MIVRFENSIEDLVAFNRYHCARSPTIRRTKYTVMTLVMIMMVTVSLFIPPTELMSRPMIVAGGVVLAGLFAAFFNYRFSVNLDRQVRRLYQEGTNPGMIGEHEIEIDERGLVERTSVNETRLLWQGVEQIVETDDFVFIYVSAMTAHVIPKRSVTVGDPAAFLVRARQLWLAAK